MKKDIYDLILHLIRLGDGTDQPSDKRLGICNELQEWAIKPLYSRRDWDYVSWLMVDPVILAWPKHTCDRAYPVPCPYLDEYFAFNHRRDLWADDEYGDNRRELCHYVAYALIRRLVKNEC